MYLGVGVCLGLLCKNVTYGWWSENICISIPDVGLQFDDNLQSKLSINVPFLCDNLVGSVIWG